MKPRFFKEEPEKVHDTSFLKEWLTKLLNLPPLTQKIEVDYGTKIEMEFPRERVIKEVSFFSELLKEIDAILKPSWFYYHKPQEEHQEFPLYPSRRISRKSWIYSFIWKPQNIVDYYDEIAKRILAEIEAILSIQRANWSSRTSVEVELEVKRPYETKLTFHQEVGKVNKRFAFSFPEDKERLCEWYSKPVVMRVLYEFMKDRYVRIKKWSEKAKKVVMKMWEVYKESLLEVKKPSDVQKLTREENMISAFTSIDRVDSERPDILVIDFDIGEMLRSLEPEKSYEFTFGLVEKFAEFLFQHGIKYFIDFTGGRGFHFLIGEDFDEPPKNYLEVVEKMGIEDERFYTLYGFNSIFAPMLSLRLLRDSATIRRVSLDPMDRVRRLYKILIESLGKKKNAIRIPLSFHEKTGLLAWRIGGWYKGSVILLADLERMRKYEEMKLLSEPENVLKSIKKCHYIYFIPAPPNNIGEFEYLTLDLKEELFKVLYCWKVDPNKNIDDAFYLRKREVKKLRKKFGV